MRINLWWKGFNIINLPPGDWLTSLGNVTVWGLSVDLCYGQLGIQWQQLPGKPWWCTSIPATMDPLFMRPMIKYWVAGKEADWHSQNISFCPLDYWALHCSRHSGMHSQRTYICLCCAHSEYPPTCRFPELLVTNCCILLVLRPWTPCQTISNEGKMDIQMYHLKFCPPRRWFFSIVPQSHHWEEL